MAIVKDSSLSAREIVVKRSTGKYMTMLGFNTVWWDFSMNDSDKLGKKIHGVPVLGQIKDISKSH